MPTTRSSIVDWILMQVMPLHRHGVASELVHPCKAFWGSEVMPFLNSRSATPSAFKPVTTSKASNARMTTTVRNPTPFLVLPGTLISSKILVPQRLSLVFRNCSHFKKFSGYSLRYVRNLRWSCVPELLRITLNVSSPQSDCCWDSYSADLKSSLLHCILIIDAWE